jgi:hypothetical protein
VYLYSGITFPVSSEKAMNTDPNSSRLPRQPEEGNDKELLLTDSDATLSSQPAKQPDSASMSYNATAAANDNLTQSVMNGSEINPEYGDAADPTFETL